jgi:hypothetical protein
MKITIFNEIKVNKEISTKRKTMMLRNIESMLIVSNILNQEIKSVSNFRKFVAPELLKLIQAHEDDVRLESNSRVKDTLEINQLKLFISKNQRVELSVE